MVDARAGTRSLLLVNFRPEYRAEWMQKSWYRQIPLAPLGPRGDRASCCADLLGNDPSLAGLAGADPRAHRRQPVLHRGGGAVADRVGQSRRARAAPTGWCADRAARGAGDRAGRAGGAHRPAREREKAVLQAAAVIGKEFSEPLLARDASWRPHELREALGRLCAAPSSSTSRRSTRCRVRLQASADPGGRARQPAAASAARASTRQSAARDRGAGRRAARRARRAAGHHWEEAGEALSAARWGARAAVWAGQTDLAAATRHWGRVRALLEDSQTTARRAGLALGACIWILQYGWRQGLSDEEVEAVWREGVSLAERSGDTWAMCALHGSHAVSRGMVGAVTDAVANALEARRLAGRCTTSISRRAWARPTGCPWSARRGRLSRT